MYTILKIERSESTNIKKWQNGWWTKINNITSGQLQVQGASVRAKKAGRIEEVLNNEKERRVEQTILRNLDKLPENNEIVQSNQFKCFIFYGYGWLLNFYAHPLFCRNSHYW